jgi:methylated-DNA-protein-cysteine methyltransferase-like protein
MTGKSNSFFEDVYEVVRLIPEGRVTTYGAIAKYLGSPLSSRMVGWAMNNAHSLNPQIPAHRVVNRNGILTGKHHFGNQGEMQLLLEKEGHNIQDDKIQNFKKALWNPEIELIIV